MELDFEDLKPLIRLPPEFTTESETVTYSRDTLTDLFRQARNYPPQSHLGNPHCYQALLDPVARYCHKMPSVVSTPPRVMRDSNPRRVYHRRDRGSLKSTVHWGQRKLLLSEIEFLIRNLKNEKIVLIYAGAAPGDHIPVLAELFDEWIDAVELYDIRQYHEDLENYEKLKINSKLFDLNDIENIKQKYPNNLIFMISDIRSVSIRDDEDNDEGILRDMKVQEEWVRLLDPAAALLKFRLAYDHVKHPSLEYLDGDLYYPVWGPRTTTECRLMTHGGAGTRIYDTLHYNEKLFYFNTIARTRPYPAGEACRSEWIREGFCSCFDCSSEFTVLSEFNQKFQKFESAFEISKFITKGLENARNPPLVDEFELMRKMGLPISFTSRS
jgi:hypothetical protein